MIKLLILRVNYSEAKKNKLIDEVNSEQQLANKKWLIEKLVELDSNSSN